MKYYYDLHIHTALSPCADILMSPHNILNMASLKGLDIIAITDHNSGLQCVPIDRLSRSYNMLVIPGVEVTTSEGYHVLCLFKNINYILMFQEFLNKHLERKTHDVLIYGEQLLFDDYDEITTTYPLSLMQTPPISIEMLQKEVSKNDGLMILAHIEKYQPVDDLVLNKMDGIEININTDISRTKIPSGKTLLRNSDAHIITAISEREHYLELKELTIEAVFAAIRGKAK